MMAILVSARELTALNIAKLGPFKQHNDTMIAAVLLDVDYHFSFVSSQRLSTSSDTHKCNYIGWHLLDFGRK